jgi:serine/threonine protein kinase
LKVLDSESEDTIDLERADVYSMGVVIWELVTSEMPWKGTRPDQVIAMVAFKGRKLDIPSDCHPSLKEIIQKCCSVAKERYTFSELAEVLQNLIQQEEPSTVQWVSLMARYLHKTNIL